MDEQPPSAWITAARRYMLAMRIFYWCLPLWPVPIILALVFPVHAVVFLLLVGCFLACTVAIAVSAIYLSDFECPQCHQVCTCRRLGRDFPLSRCLNCGLSLKALAAAA
jgi:hypothetical protein